MRFRRVWGVVIVTAIALSAVACGGSDDLEANETPTTRRRLPAVVVPSTSPDPTTPFGGVPIGASTTTTARATTGGASPTSTPAATPRAAPPATPMPAARTAVGSATWQGLIVVAAGFDVAGAPSSRVDSYNPTDGSWATAPNLPMALHHVSLAVLDGDLWAIGGFSVEGDQSIARAETYVFRPGGDHWEEGPALHTPRGGAAVGALGERLIAVGGATTDGAALDTVEVLTAGASDWSAGAPLAHKRAYASAIVGGGRIYVAGGRTDTVGSSMRGVESWASTGNWRAEASLATPRSEAAAAGLCVGGGENGSGVVGSVECIAARAWTTRFTMNVPRHGLAAGAADGWLHLIGGGPSSGKSVNTAHEVFDLAK